MRKFWILSLVIFASIFTQAQRQNTFYVQDFPGTTVQQKKYNAEAQCNPSTAIPCFIIIDPTLATWTNGNPVTDCVQCAVQDYRAGIPAPGVVSAGALTGTLPASVTPAYTGDSTSSAGSTVTTVVGIKGSPVPTLATGYLYYSGSALLWQPIPSAIEAGVRQTVSAGPVDVNGLPTLFPASSVSLSLVTQNVTASAPFVATAAKGQSAVGKVDYVFQSTANLTWSGLAASSTVYLYINASSGALGSTTLQPIYQFGGTPSVTSGQFTFNISQMIGYLGNGSTATATPIVFVGEVVTGTSTITSTIAYAYSGFYDSGLTATFPGTSTSVSRSVNLGVMAYSANVIAQCTTSENGYAVGDQVLAKTNYSSSTGNSPINVTINRNTVWFTTGNGGALTMQNKTAPGGIVTATGANWSYKVVASRGW